MSRNSSGTYTLPVADKAPLQVIPAADWNSLFNDLKTEMTDSLNRSGKGGMLAPLELAAGTEALPGITFVLEPSSGLYRAGAGDIRMSLLDTDILKFTAGAVDVTGTLDVTGLVTADSLAITNAVTLSSTLTAAGVITGATIEATGDTAAGDNSAMGYTSTSGLVLTGQGSIRDITIRNDAGSTVLSILTGTTGVVLAGALAVSGATTLTGGIATATTATGNFTMSNAAGPALFDEAATSANPTLLPNKADADTGIGWASANVGMLIAGGSGMANWSASRFSMANAAGSAMMNEAATATNPTLVPNIADTDTGLGWVSSNTLSFITAGIERYRLSLSGLQINVPLISTNTSDATSTSTGSIRTGGGIASTKDIFAGADIVLTGGLLAHNATTSTVMSGGTTATLGGNVVTYGETHASLANDIQFRSGSTILAAWDNSDDQWEFKKDVVFEQDIVLTGLIVGSSATSTVHISGGTTGILGANMVLYAQTHATLADDVVFRHDAVDTLRYDASDAQWEFKKDVVFEAFMGFGVETELTIASGVVTATKGFHKIDTESDAGSDDLDTINGGSEGNILVISPVVTGRNIVVKDAVGNLQINGDFLLAGSHSTMMLIRTATLWIEISRSDNH